MARFLQRHRHGPSGICKRNKNMRRLFVATAICGSLALLGCESRPANQNASNPQPRTANRPITEEPRTPTEPAPGGVANPQPDQTKPADQPGAPPRANQPGQ